MLNILLMIILIIIIFIIILLYIGVKIAFIYNKKGSKLKGCLKILILKKIKVYSIEFPSEDDEKDEDEEDDEENDRDIKKIFELAKPCFEDFKEFLKSFTKCIHIAKLENHLVFGLDSYVDTAKYIGCIWSLLVIVNSTHENARLTAEPSFTGSVLDAKGENELDINILKLIPPAIKLISKKEIRNLIKGVRNG
ncbi:DUF2953 domain-containing protein [uncultured Methanobrevibacter sp.]|uniref:DUF2953 domain-containing protein n=1 Tax=uncultured Methanobrevibacter sp. TaxID=253161 RepID=UPI0025EE8953|nr:DUF2953 domain-containing protein [uncultured Methanobrevibacter sp.]